MCIYVHMYTHTIFVYKCMFYMFIHTYVMYTRRKPYAPVLVSFPW